MKNKLNVSFVLGIRNAERTLRECLNGILMQNYPKEMYEIIIVDGNSTDSTLSIIDEYMNFNKNLILMHNPKKLSEGRGMSKDLGIKAAKGKFVVLLDHDNIILGKDWLKQMLSPFNDKSIMASQSLLDYTKGDSNFIKYVNTLGVEDPFATPYSLVAQVVLHPNKFRIINDYYIHELNPRHVLFGGANGCVFRKEVFEDINGYTRDVDVFASMADLRMKVAVPLNPRVYHKTSSDLFNFMKKKGIYFYRFIKNDYKIKKYNWVERRASDKLRFLLLVLSSLSILPSLITSLNQVFKTGKFFWLLHPFYVFYISLEYIIISLFNIKNFLHYYLR